ncbi:hypothetical protein BDU57DRAFT_184081 [Ampelomyces quisqualis]|uniref:Uncharacterized protein n=1 Tax=Ampelomyces quisqualis TaxID=50730 RepID=A0A6A5QRI3_AMPQU|nr:hypothetical protein BDU57DRAFT_184081 [Ampelomyces quisqualis]
MRSSRRCFPQRRSSAASSLCRGPRLSSGDNEAPANVLVSYVILRRRSRDGPTRWPRGGPLLRDRPATPAPAVWPSCSLCCARRGCVLCCAASHSSHLIDAHPRRNGARRRCAQSAVHSCTRCDAAPLSSDRAVPQQETISAPRCRLLQPCRTKLMYSSASARANVCLPRRLHALPRRMTARPLPARFHLRV